MARVAAQITNFTAGELSPRLDGRNDIAKYSSGCKTLENLVIYPHGAAARRPGTQFIAEVKTSSAKTRLIPFEFSTTQTYILEFGNQYMRVYKDKGQVLSGGFSFKYDLPGDCLRLLRILDYDSNHKVEGRSILSNNSSMKILYISRVTDPNQYSDRDWETITRQIIFKTKTT